MLNETDKLNPLFKLYPAEGRIRWITSQFTNTYIVGVYACCREVYNPKFYMTFVVATSKSEAEKMIEEQKQADAAYKAKYKTADKDQIISLLQGENDQLSGLTKNLVVEDN